MENINKLCVFILCLVFPSYSYAHAGFGKLALLLVGMSIVISLVSGGVAVFITYLLDKKYSILNKIRENKDVTNVKKEIRNLYITVYVCFTVLALILMFAYAESYK